MAEHICELTDRGLELDNGGIIEWPECDGTICRRNSHGDLEELWQPGDDGYEEWLHLFPVDHVEVEYTVTMKQTLRLPRHLYHLESELAEIRVPQDDCTTLVAGSLAVKRVVKNGEELPRPRPVDR